MRNTKPAACRVVGFVLAVTLMLPGLLCAQPAPSSEPPVIPIGFDAFTQWHKWPYLRLGVRAYMKSTFDRNGGNHNADAAHFIRQVDDEHNVVLDEAGPGMLWFVRHNHWHGSPWHYAVDGRETVVQESSTADPVNPVPGSVFIPERLFPQGLTWTWSVTKGADLSWVPIPFEKHFQLAYGRARYGTGYFIFWKLMPGMANLSRPLRSWAEEDVPPAAVVALLARSGEDIAPAGARVREQGGQLALAPYQTQVLFHVREGPATVRRLAFRVPEADADRLARARLRIYWDNRPVPSVEAPLGLFFGTASLMRDPEQTYVVKSFPMTVKWEGGHVLFATYFPMPFHRSARVELAETTGEPLTGVTWEVRHEPYEDPPNWVGYFHATYRDFPRPQPGRDLELLDTRSVEGGGPWCGHVVGTTYLFTRRGRLQTLEGDPRFYFDDSLSPQGQGTGSEEWGGGGDYWGGRTMTLPFAGHPVGRPPDQAQTDLERIHSAYRFLLSDLMPFGRNARITLEHGGVNTEQEHYETVAYWYGQDAACLVLTDALDVGDESDEARHAYRAPGASPIDTLVSRFEWGIDRVSLPGAEDAMKSFEDVYYPDSAATVEVFPPLADDGRRTTQSSEFTLRLRPDNLGVLLRRRLDLAYPNQRARVWIGAAEGEPAWQEAGIWYTAGGNTVVFGDPRVLPKEELTVHPEMAPPVHRVETSNRRWREDEFLIGRQWTQGRTRIRVRIEPMPLGLPLFPGHPLAQEAWTAYRYWAYSYVMP